MFPFAGGDGEHSVFESGGFALDGVIAVGGRVVEDDAVNENI